MGLGGALAARSHRPIPASNARFGKRSGAKTARTSRAASPRAERGEKDNQAYEEDRKDHRRAKTACLHVAWDGVISLYQRYEIKLGLPLHLLAGSLFTHIQFLSLLLHPEGIHGCVRAGIVPSVGAPAC